MSSVPKTFNIQGVQLALQLEPEDLPLIEKAVNEINQAVRNVNQGKDLILTPKKQTRIQLYAFNSFIQEIQPLQQCLLMLERSWNRC